MSRVSHLDFDISKYRSPNFVVGEVAEDTLRAVDLSQLAARAQFDTSEFLSPAGREHYKLLSHLSTLVDGAIIVDIGTHMGASALALSRNPNNTVITFDIDDHCGLPPVDNIRKVTANLWDPDTRKKWELVLLNAPIIFLDITPHAGKMEYEFYQFLSSNDYRGLLVLDDIWFFKEMRDNLWFKIPSRFKRDMTLLGHWSGTGFVTFSVAPSLQPSPDRRSPQPEAPSLKPSPDRSPQPEAPSLEPSPDRSSPQPEAPSLEPSPDRSSPQPEAPSQEPSPERSLQPEAPSLEPSPDRSSPQPGAPSKSWTLVTAYYDLTAMPDASAGIRSRPKQHYLEHARATMAVEQNLVVYCESQNLEALQALRPSYLAHRTRYVVQSFELFPLTHCRGTIQENRQRHPYHFDDRNTPSYYLFCVARCAMLKQAMETNCFDSTHFGWINLCMERMGFSNLVYLEEALSLFRDKVSSCFIDYIPESLVRDVPTFYQWGRCSMCSGFYTGRADHLKEFCDRVENKFTECLLQGYGHADEQLFVAVFFDKPQLFDLYFGDYSEMISNYRYVREHAQNLLRLTIPKSAADSRWTDVCLPACRALWTSVKKGKSDLPPTSVPRLLHFYSEALTETNQVEELQALMQTGSSN